MKFEITDKQKEKMNKWLKDEIYPEQINKQKEYLKEHADVADLYGYCHKNGYPYEGAIGGGVTYKFTPTSVGTVVKAVAYDKELDLTDYDSF
jgi:hypothetical protein